MYQMGGGNLCDYIKKKTISLLIPFIIFSIIELPIAIYIGTTTFDRWIVSGWQGIALWFIPVLYLSLLISKWVLNIISVYMRVALIAFFLVIGVVLCYFDIGHNWTLSSIPYATFLIILGAYSKRWIQAIYSTKWYYVIGALIVTIVVSQIWRLDMAWNHMSPVIPITVGACSGTYLVFCISSYICIYILQTYKGYAKCYRQGDLYHTCILSNHNNVHDTLYRMVISSQIFNYDTCFYYSEAS